MATRFMGHGGGEGEGAAAAPATSHPKTLRGTSWEYVCSHEWGEFGDLNRPSVCE